MNELFLEGVGDGLEEIKMSFFGDEQSIWQEGFKRCLCQVVRFEVVQRLLGEQNSCWMSMVSLGSSG